LTKPTNQRPGNEAFSGTAVRVRKSPQCKN
jgi:hypothetical protein